MEWDFIEDKDLRTKVAAAHDSAITVLNDGVASKITEATDGLSRKNAEILDEKKQLEQKYEGINPDEVKDAVSFYEKNKDAKFLESGKIDELVDQKTSQLRSDHEDVLKEINGELTTAKDVGSKFQGLYETKVLEDDLRLAAVIAKVLPEALDDVVARAKNVFSLGEDFKTEARDKEGALLKTDNDIIVTTTNWMESLKESAPYFWPQSEGAGFLGKGKNKGDATDNMENLAKTDHAKFVELRRKQTSKK